MNTRLIVRRAVQSAKREALKNISIKADEFTVPEISKDLEKKISKWYEMVTEIKEELETEIQNLINAVPESLVQVINDEVAKENVDENMDNLDIQSAYDGVFNVYAEIQKLVRQGKY